MSDAGDGPLARYRARVAEGALQPDRAQEEGARRLQGLHDALKTQGLASKSSALGWLFARRTDAPPPKGLYLWGEVGRGKSLLMDLFFETAPVSRKRRVHFHAFMGEVQERLHAERARLRDRDEERGDPIPPVAKAILAETRLLCFDEFQVTDIADAMILGRLFTALFEGGLVCVATSNVSPDDLYAGGLNRALFLPFILLLKERMEVFHLAARTDFRREKLSADTVYFTPLGPQADAAMDAAWRQLTEGAPGAPETLHVKRRALPVPRAAQGPEGRVARFAFDDLCRKPLGAHDYLKIAATYAAVLVDRIPKLEAHERNEARRFVWLVDALYEHDVKLVASAAVEPERIYARGDTAFEFARTVSRLIEMRSSEYLDRPHGAHGASRWDRQADGSAAVPQG